MAARGAVVLAALLSGAACRPVCPVSFSRALASDQDESLFCLQTAALASDASASSASTRARLHLSGSTSEPKPSRNASVLPRALRALRGRDDHVPPNAGAGVRHRQTMVNSEDVQYAAAIRVGEQDMMGVLDTGSFELVVFSNVCDMCGDKEKLYVHWRSSTYDKGKLTATHSYGSGDVLSQEAFETVQIGPLRAGHQKFWEVTSAHMPLLASASFQAIVGVGPPNVPADEAWEVAREGSSDVQWFRDHDVPVPADVKRTVVDNVKIARWTSGSTTMLDSFGVRLFSVCLGAVPLSDGYFVWNDDDPRQKLELFTPLPVTGHSTWGVQMFDASLAGAVRGSTEGWSRPLGCQEGCGAIVDSGTSLLAVPPEVIVRVQEALEGLDVDCGNLKDMPSLVFRIGEHSFSLPPDAYIGEVVGEVPTHFRSLVHLPALVGWRSQCQLLLMEQDSATQFGPMWILGMPFFRKYYTTFDVGIGGSGEGRSMFVSLADSQCEPMEKPKQPVGGPILLGSKVATRRVNASQLTLPMWAQRAAREKHMAI